MSLRQRTVSGYLYSADELTPIAGGTVIVALEGGGFTVDGSFAPDRITATTGTDGRWELTLWCEDDSLIATHYRIKQGDDRVWRAFDLPYGDGSDISIATLLSAGLVTPDPSNTDLLTALVNAHAASTNTHTFLHLIDAPDTYSGQAGKHVVVNGTADGLEFTDASAGTVTDVTGAAPITSTGGSTPEIGITAATTLAAGSMSAADKVRVDALGSASTHPASDFDSAGAAAGAVATHEAASDPHSQYLTQAEADALYDPLGSAGSSTLAGLTDVNEPSPANADTLQYLTSDNKWHNQTPMQARSNLGLGSAATHPSTDFDAAGAAAAVQANVDALTTADVPDSANARYVTDAELVVIGNTSGTNTGDQVVPGFATPSIALGTAAAAGAASTVIRSDATIAAFDATAPVTQNYGDSAATGSAAVAARRDHVHGMPASVGFANPMTTQDDVIVGGASGAAGRLGKGSDGQVLTVDPSTHHLVWATPSAGFADPTTTKGDLIVHGASTTRMGVGSNGDVLTADSAQSLGVKWAPPAVTMSADEMTYWRDQASLLDPLCLEVFNAGTFSYVVGAGVTKYVIASFKTRFGSSGQFEVRDPRKPLALSGVTLAGYDSISGAITLDPTLATYTDPKATYYSRLVALNTTTPRYLPITAAAQVQTFLPGPYGSILLLVTDLDMTWVVIRPYGATLGINLMNELGNDAVDYQSNSNVLMMPLSKAVCTSLESGLSRSGGSPLGGILYVHMPSSWSTIVDGTSYTFRDDFMGSSLDTSTNWTRAQSTSGNVEINTNFQWCQVKGDGSTWGANGAYSKPSIARATGKVFMCDVHAPRGIINTDMNLVVGFSDGAGHSYTNFSHGLDFTGNGGRALQVFENGNSRGGVGSGWTPGSTYRVRITLGSSNNATYEIQSNDGVYGAFGSSTWTNITPGTSSSSTTPLHAGFTKQTAQVCYVSDVKIY